MGVFVGSGVSLVLRTNCHSIFMSMWLAEIILITWSAEFSPIFFSFPGTRLSSVSKSRPSVSRNYSCETITNDGRVVRKLQGSKTLAMLQYREPPTRVNRSKSLHHRVALAEEPLIGCFQTDRADRLEPPTAIPRSQSQRINKLFKNLVGKSKTMDEQIFLLWLNFFIDIALITKFYQNDNRLAKMISFSKHEKFKLWCLIEWAGCWCLRLAGVSWRAIRTS